MRALIILGSTAALAACNLSADAQEGTGEVAQRAFSVGAFEGVALAGSQDVVVTMGGQPSVRAEGDPEIIDRLDIRVEDGTLRIGTKKGANWNANFMNNREPVTVYVTAPRLNAAMVAGSGDMSIDNIQSDRFKAAVAGSGDLQIAAIRAGEAEFSLAGSGDLRAAGTVERVRASVAGSGDIDISGIDSANADISVAGSGNVQARARDAASVAIVGSGDVSVAGEAKCSVSKRGSGEVRCGG